MADAALYDTVARELRQMPPIGSAGNLNTRALVPYGVLAAEAGGYASEVSIDTDKDEIRIEFTNSRSAGPTDPFAAIPHRQCTKTRYDGSALRQRG